MFMKTAGQEADVYDINYLKYMRTQERGMTRPTPLPSLFNGYSTTRNGAKSVMKGTVEPVGPITAKNNNLMSMTDGFSYRGKSLQGQKTSSDV